MRFSSTEDYSDQIIPMGLRLLVVKQTPEAESEGGIVLPDIVQENEKQQCGQVLRISRELDSVQNEKDFKGRPILPDDWVLFPTFVGTEFEVGDATYIVFESADIMCVLESPAERETIEIIPHDSPYLDPLDEARKDASVYGIGNEGGPNVIGS